MREFDELSNMMTADDTGVGAPKYRKRCAATRRKSECLNVWERNEAEFFEKKYSNLTTIPPSSIFCFC